MATGLFRRAEGIDNSMLALRRPPYRTMNHGTACAQVSDAKRKREIVLALSFILPVSAMTYKRPAVPSGYPADACSAWRTFRHHNFLLRSAACRLRNIFTLHTALGETQSPSYGVCTLISRFQILEGWRRSGP